MTLDQANEAAGVLGTALQALQAAVPSQSGRAGAAFRYQCGTLLAQGVALVSTGAIGTPLQACFASAVAAGATLNGLLAVRNAMTALSPVGQPAVIVAGACYAFSLAGEATVLSATPFVSSADALQALAVFAVAVGNAQDWSLDNHLTAQYQALLALGAAVARDLQARAAQLPLLVVYSIPSGTSSLVLAYRLYGDANRADELRAENGVNNPAFMPPSGTALSE